MTAQREIRGTPDIDDWRRAFWEADELLRRAHILAMYHDERLQHAIESFYDRTEKLTGRDKICEPTGEI